MKIAVSVVFVITHAARMPISVPPVELWVLRPRATPPRSHPCTWMTAIWTDAIALRPILERKAAGQWFSDRVEVVDCMVHGCTYPASTNVEATSVGQLPIRCFLRPVSY